MATSLFHDIIFGPVKSRRLGLSLGVNLLPLDTKLCNFNCIYCECGWTGIDKGVKPRFNSREDVRQALQTKLEEMAADGQLPDVITFAGNGEPTMHPRFEEIIDDTLNLRDRISPSSKVSVLTNGTMIGRDSVRRALMRVDNNIVKLDSAFDDTVRLIDDPQGRYSVGEVISNIEKFQGHVIIQTMFLRGVYKGTTVDNTTDAEISAWLEKIAHIRPQKVMIYTIDRDTPASDLQKVTVEELNVIADRVRELGIECSVSG